VESQKIRSDIEELCEQLRSLDWQYYEINYYCMMTEGFVTCQDESNLRVRSLSSFALVHFPEELTASLCGFLWTLDGY
jgi:hypothetical protein